MRTKTLIKHEDRKLLQSYNNFIDPFQQWGIAGITRGFSGRVTMFLEAGEIKNLAGLWTGFLSYSCKQPGLFGYYFKFNFCAVAIAEIDGSLIGTQFLYLVGNGDLLAIDFISLLFADSAAELQ
jgi:hypothetical protein